MLRTKNLFMTISSNLYAISYRKYQVTVIGCANETGQTLSLLLKTHPLINTLVLYDTAEYTPGIALDLAHVPSNSQIKAFKGEESLESALENSNLIITTGESQQKWSTHEELSKNTEFVKKVAEKVATMSPLPFLGIATEPINTLVPMAAEVMRNHECYHQKKLLGITTIDALKAQTLYAKENELHPKDCFVPVVGGHSPETMVPLLSQANPVCKFTKQKIHEFTAKLRNDDIYNTSKELCSPTLSMAYSVYVFAQNILEALNGHQTQVNGFVENNDFGTLYFSGLVDLTKNGFGEMRNFYDLSKYECQLLEKCLQSLRKDVSTGKRILELD